VVRVVGRDAFGDHAVEFLGDTFYVYVVRLDVIKIEISTSLILSGQMKFIQNLMESIAM
jgi:hypothetical protein